MVYCENRNGLIVKVFRKAAALVLALLLTAVMMPTAAFASATVDIRGGDNVKGGDTFTLSVTFGGSIGRVDAGLNYDTDKLTYISGGSSSGNSGYVQLKNGSTDGTIVFNIEFQAVSEGDTSVEIEAFEAYDLNEQYMEGGGAAKTISITGAAKPEELVTETTSPDKPAAETTLAGVDEKPDSEDGNGEGNNNDKSNLVMILMIAIPLILIIIISAVIIAKKKRGGKAAAKQDFREYDDYNGFDDYDGGYKGYVKQNDRDHDGGSYDSSFKNRDTVLYNDGFRNYEDGSSDDTFAGRSSGEYGEGDLVNEEPRHMSRMDRYGKKKKVGRNTKKMSSDETERWDEWDGFDDNDLR